MDDNHEITRKLQQVELDILKDFIKVCDKLDINYYMIGGTLIDAVRHQGFIPWDDDIDVCMMRKDYDIFLENGQKYLNKKYFLQTYETDKEYPGCFAKIRDVNTTFLEKSVKNKDMNHGIFIDIFPLDAYHKYNRTKEKLIYYKLYNEIFINDKSLTRRLVANISNILYRKKTKLELCKKQEKLYIKSNGKSKYVTNYCGAWGIKRETHNINCFKNYKMVKFEGIDVKIPCGYDEILTTMYGDYMKLPPKEKQVSHHYADIIDTQKSYKEYMVKDIKN